ncbi:MAG: hypothetical protein ACK5JB_14570 [Pseudanabaena sp.]
MFDALGRTLLVKLLVDRSWRELPKTIDFAVTIGLIPHVQTHIPLVMEG